MTVLCWSVQAAMNLALLLTWQGSVMLHAGAAGTRPHLQPQDGVHVQMVGRLILKGEDVHQVTSSS